MRVAFICPSEVRNAIYNKWLGNLFAQYTYIKFDVMEYDEFRKVTDIARKAQENHDGLLFSGYQAYSYAKKRITPKCVWGAVKIRSSAFLRALLEAKQKRYDISNISIDSYTWEEIAQTFEEIGFQITRDSMFLYEPQMAEDDYEQIESIYQFHKKNWLRHKCSCCITTRIDILLKLREDNIPAFHAFPRLSEHREAIKELYLNYIAKMNERNQIVILSIGLSKFNEYSLVSTNDYNDILDKIEMTKYIYKLAQDISGVVVELSLGQYLLFSTRSVVEALTDQFKSLKILDDLEKITLEHAYVGIGFGETVMESKYNAISAMEKAYRYHQNTAFINIPGQPSVGPLFSSTTPQEKEEEIIDDKIVEMSRVTGVGINRLVNIITAIRGSNKDCFLSKELAQMCGLSVRSMDRIINALEDGGYAQVIGKKQEGYTGRPSRLIRITLDRNKK